MVGFQKRLFPPESHNHCCSPGTQFCCYLSRCARHTCRHWRGRHGLHHDWLERNLAQTAVTCTVVIIMFREIIYMGKPKIRSEMDGNIQSMLLRWYILVHEICLMADDLRGAVAYVYCESKMKLTSSVNLDCGETERSEPEHSTHVWLSE